MKLTDALLGEHGVIYALFNRLEQAFPELKTGEEARQMAATLAAALASHAAIENEFLFPALEPHLGPAGPLAVMRQEHEEIESALQAATTAAAPAAAVESLQHVLAVARDHFSKEERVLFRMAQQTLGDEGLLQLGQRWAERRRVFVS